MGTKHGGKDRNKHRKEPSKEDDIHVSTESRS